MKNYQLVLEFLVNLKADPSKIDAVIEKLSETAEEFELDINIESFEQNVREGVKALEVLDQEINKMNNKGLDIKGVDSLTDEINKAIEGVGVIDISDLEKSLNNLDDTEFEKIKDTLKDAFENFDDKKLQLALKNAGNDFTKLKQEAKDALNSQQGVVLNLARSGQKDTDAYREAVEELKRRREVLNQIVDKEKEVKAAIDSTNQTNAKMPMLDQLAKLGMAFQAFDQFKSSLDQFQQPFIELDKQARNIGTLGVKNFQEFSDAAVELSKTVPDSAGEIAEGVYDAISAGTVKVTDGMANVGDGMKFVEVASKLAAAGLTSTKESVNGLTSVMNAYGIEAGKASEISDIFFGAVNVGKTTVPELNASMANVIPTASAFGVAFDQVAGAIATMTKQGTPTAQATTQIRAALVEIAKPGKELEPIMKKAGVSLQSLKAEGLQVTMKKLGEALAASGKSATQAFSSVEAAGAVMLLSGKNAKMAAEDFETVKNSIGSTDAAFAVASEGIAAKQKTLGNQIQAIYNGIFKAIGPGFQSILDYSTKLAPVMMTLSAFKSVFPTDAVKNLASSIISKLIPAYAAQAAASTAAGAAGTASFGAMAAAVWSAMVPLLPFIAALAGVGVALYAITGGFNKSAESKMKDTEALIENNNKQIEHTQNMIKQEEQNTKLIARYEQLIKAKKDGEDVDKELQSTMEKLNKQYPDAIDLTKKHEENLKAVKEATGLANAETSKFTDSNRDLIREFETLSNKTERTKEEEKKLLKVKKDLQKEFPGVIEGSNNTADAIAKMKEQAGMTTTNMKDMVNKLQGFQKEASRLKELYAQTKFKKILEDAEDTLSGFMGLSWTNATAAAKTVVQNFAKEIEKITDPSKLEAKWNYYTEAYRKRMAAAGGLNTEAYTEGEKAMLQLLEQKHEMLLANKKLEDKSDDNKPDDNKPAADDNTKKEKEKKKDLFEQWEIINKKFATEKNEYLQNAEAARLEADRTKNIYDELDANEKKLSFLKQQREEILKIYGNLVSADDKGLFDIKPDLKIDAEDKKKLLEKIESFNTELRNTNIEKLQLNIKVNAEEEDYQKKLKEFQKKELALKITLGLAKESDWLPILQKEFDEANQKLEDNKANQLKLKMVIDDPKSSEEARKEAQKVITNLRNEEIELGSDHLAKLETLNDKKEQIYKDETEKIKAELEKQQQEIDDYYEKQVAASKQFLEALNSKYNEMESKRLSDQNEILNEQSQNELDEWEHRKEIGVISTEQYEKTKEEIEKKYRDKREQAEKEANQRRVNLENVNKGMLLVEQAKKDEAFYSAQVDSIEKQRKILEDKRKLNAKTGQLKFVSAEDSKAYDELNKQLEMAEELLQTKGEALMQFGEVLKENTSNMFAEMFVGDEDAMENAAKKTIGVLVGIIEKYLTAAIMQILLSSAAIEWVTTTLAELGPYGILALPAVEGALYGIVSGGLHALINPLLSTLTSFSTGGRVESPTMAIIGDAGKLGSSNREWIFRDDQFKQALAMASSGGSMELIQRLDRLEAALMSQTIETTLKGNDIVIAQKRTQRLQNMRRV